MKLDLKKLCRAFTAAPEEAVVSTEGINEYLVTQVLLPALAGESIQIKNIDCTKFDQEDVRWLAGYYDSLDTQADKLVRFIAPITKIDPIASKKRAFC